VSRAAAMLARLHLCTRVRVYVRLLASSRPAFVIRDGGTSYIRIPAVALAAVKTTALAPLGTRGGVNRRAASI
jgi:hypothetical protein